MSGGRGFKISADKVTVTSIEGGIRVEAEGIAVHGSTGAGRKCHRRRWRRHSISCR